jgi:hypothetical protein
MRQQLVPIAEGILFQKKIEKIFETLLTTPAHLFEAEEGEELSAPEKKAMDSLMQTFVAQLKKGAGEVKADTKDSKEIDSIKNDYPELKKLDSKVEEGDLNEFVISGALIAGIVAAVPKLIELFGYLVKGVGAVLGKFGFKKASDKTKQFAEKIMHAGHSVHESYIGSIQGGLKMLIPGFSELPGDKQKQLAEIVYMIIVLTLGLDAGVNAASALKSAEWVHFGVEGALTAIKSGEVGVWLSKAITSTVV